MGRDVPVGSWESGLHVHLSRHGRDPFPEQKLDEKEIDKKEIRKIIYKSSPMIFFSFIVLPLSFFFFLQKFTNPFSDRQKQIFQTGMFEPLPRF